MSVIFDEPGTSYYPKLNGRRISLPDNPAIYLIDEGQKRWVVDPPTYDGLFRDWDGILGDYVLEDIINGPDLAPGTMLAWADGATVYLLDVAEGVKRHIASPAAMDAYHFSWDAIRSIAAETLAQWPEGPAIR